MGQDKSLVVGNRVFRSGFSPTQGHLAVHFRFVTSQKGQVVSLDQKVREFQLALGCPLIAGLGFSEAVQELIAGGKIYVWEDKVGMQPEGPLGFFRSEEHTSEL